METWSVKCVKYFAAECHLLLEPGRAYCRTLARYAVQAVWRGEDSAGWCNNGSPKRPVRVRSNDRTTRGHKRSIPGGKRLDAELPLRWRLFLLL